MKIYKFTIPVEGYEYFEVLAEDLDKAKELWNRNPNKFNVADDLNYNYSGDIEDYIDDIIEVIED